MSFGMSGGGSKSKSKSRTTNVYQDYATPTVQDLIGQLSPMMQRWSAAAQNMPTGMTDLENKYWQQTMAEGDKWGAQGPYAALSSKYLEPTMGAGWMQQLSPYYSQQTKNIQEAMPASNDAFWQSMKREMGPLWGRSGRAADQVAEAYGRMQMDRARELNAIQAQQAQAAQTGMQYTGGMTQQLADMQNPYTWGQQQLGWAGMPQDIAAQRAQQAQGMVMPWSQTLAGLAEMGYMYPQTSVTRGSEKSFGMGGQAGCCFIFMEGDMLTDWVRKFRDAHFPKEHSFVSDGYRRLATWLVPKMRKNKFMKAIVKGAMLLPLAKYAEAYYTKNTAMRLLLIPPCIVWTLTYAAIGFVANPNKLMDWEKYFRLGV